MADASIAGQRLERGPELRLVVNSEQVTPLVETFPIDIDGARGSFTIEHAQAAISETPLVEIGGFAGIEQAYVDMRSSIAELGTDAVSTDLPRVMPMASELEPKNLFHPHRLTSHGICAVINGLAEQGYDQVDLAVHSKAGRDVMWAAMHMPERVRSIVFMGSVGVAEHSILRLASRVPKFAATELPGIIRNASDELIALNSACKLVRHLAARPHRTLAEIVTIHYADVDARIDELIQKGIRIGVLEFANDSLLPPERTHDHLPHRIHSHQVMTSGRAGHGAPVEQPADTASMVVNMLREMNGPA